MQARTSTAPRPRRGGSGMSPEEEGAGPASRRRLRPVRVRTADTTPPNLHTPLTRSIVNHLDILTYSPTTTHKHPDLSLCNAEPSEPPHIRCGLAKHDHERNRVCWYGNSDRKNGLYRISHTDDHCKRVFMLTYAMTRFECQNHHRNYGIWHSCDDCNATDTDTPALPADPPTTAEGRRANAASSHVTSRFTAGRFEMAHASFTLRV